MFASFLAKIANFGCLEVEISEVLPVEISTEKSGQISSFTGKQNKSFGPLEKNRTTILKLGGNPVSETRIHSHLSIMFKIFYNVLQGWLFERLIPILFREIFGVHTENPATKYGKAELVDAPWHNFISEILKNIKLVNNVSGNANMTIEISTGNKY